MAELDWDVADRMRKALRHADVGVGEMADYLGVSRQSVGRYINGHVSPDRRTLRLWAIRCGVPLDWLLGELLPRMDSNHQPADNGNDLLEAWREPARHPRGARAAELLAMRTLLPISRRDLARSADATSTVRPVAHGRA